MRVEPGQVQTVKASTIVKRRADEEKRLVEMTIPKKQKRLYDRIKYSQKKKRQEVNRRKSSQTEKLSFCFCFVDFRSKNFKENDQTTKNRRTIRRNKIREILPRKVEIVFVVGFFLFSEKINQIKRDFSTLIIVERLIAIVVDFGRSQNRGKFVVELGWTFFELKNTIFDKFVVFRRTKSLKIEMNFSFFEFDEFRCFTGIVFIASSAKTERFRKEKRILLVFRILRRFFDRLTKWIMQRQRSLHWNQVWIRIIDLVMKPIDNLWRMRRRATSESWRNSATIWSFCLHKSFRCSCFFRLTIADGILIGVIDPRCSFVQFDRTRTMISWLFVSKTNKNSTLIEFWLVRNCEFEQSLEEKEKQFFFWARRKFTPQSGTNSALTVSWGSSKRLSKLVSSMKTSLSTKTNWNSNGHRFCSLKNFVRSCPQ